MNEPITVNNANLPIFRQSKGENSMLQTAPTNVMYEKSRDDAKVDPIFSTMHYHIFHLDYRNRTIDPKNVRRLANRIRRKNLLREFPIVVDEKMTVIDGQTRLKAAEELGVPIFYVISHQATIEDIADTNAATDHWDMADYLHTFCASGKPDYLALHSFWTRYPFLLVSVAIDLCNYGDYTHRSEIFKSGDYKLNDLDFATRVAQALLDFKELGIPFYRDRAFINAVANLMANSDYNHQIMLARLQYQKTKLVKCATAPLYINLFNEIYNYRARENRVQLEFLNPRSKKYRADRKATRNAENPLTREMLE